MFVLLGTVTLLLVMPCAMNAICFCVQLVHCDNVQHHD